MNNDALTLTRLKGVKHVLPGDDLSNIIIEALNVSDIVLKDGDILVLAQKIVSKSEGRLINLTTIDPSRKAIRIARKVGKRPELVELILTESNEVLRTRLGTIIVKHKSGFVCANAGIDHSNVLGSWGNPNDWVLLLPKDADLSADRIRKAIEEQLNIRIGILIIDSHGRAWRLGTIGMAIGLSGMPGLVDMRGIGDLYDYKLRVTVIDAADELAAGASLMMGQAGEGTPIIHVRGFPYDLREGNASELVRPKKLDLFR
ncbi:MAG: coenzyme F420-0:L-glutamate ligase [Anaerolineaceae bacterium]|nr:coenzyme F420-0:L-glutamate ligase [Anaerolineaceae bacterium]